ncbi:hypothetical protein C8J56DRAFT_1100211 [Mycena floridula]|nr:hypothetical protein C8J56DRAFT_1100211 [Mycena floridula]
MSLEVLTELVRILTDRLKLKEPPFPPEIISAILGYLSADKAALSTCSLVCRGWLFGSIEHAALQNPDRRIVTVLRHPLCTIFPCVHTITFNGSLDDGHLQPMLGDPDWMNALLQYFPKFTALKSLQLVYLETLYFDKILTNVTIKFREAISTLDIYGPCFTSLQYLSGFISTFPSMINLVCDLSNTDEMSGLEDDIYSEPQSVKPLPDSLQNLTLAGHNLSPSVAKWLIESNSLNWSPLILPAYNRAWEISFGGEIFVLTDSCSSLQRRYTTLLARAPSTLERITLSMERVENDSSMSLPFGFSLTSAWASVDIILSGPRFPNLSKFTLQEVTEYHDYDTEWPKLLRKLNKRGIISTGLVDQRGFSWRVVECAA